MRALLTILLFSLPSFCADPPSLTHDILPIFDANCSGCHAANVTMGSLDLDSYAGILKGGNNGTIIVPGKSAESRLYLMVAHKMMPGMPLTGKPLAAGEIELIRKWIDAGAKDDSAGAARPKRTAIPDIRPRRAVHAQISALAYRPDGKLIALGVFQEVKLADPATGATLAELKGHAEQVRSAAFSRDGKLLAAAGGLPAQKGEVKIWNVDSRTELLTISGHADCIYAVAFSPDGKSLATSSYDKLIKIWDAANGKEVRTLKDHIDAVYALAFTPDGKRIVSAGADRTVKVWDAATGERLYTMSEPSDGLNTIAIDPSGKLVAAGGFDKTIRIWELGEKNAVLKTSLIAHEDAILKLAWSPDGKVLLSSAADRTLKAFDLRDTHDLTELKDYSRQPDWVEALDFAPDGKKFAAGRFDGSLAFFDAPNNNLARKQP